MRRVVDLLKLLHRDVGIALCRGEAGVPQQLLDAAHVRPSAQQVRGERVAQR
ncbi:hypothetical protein STIAU_7143, partial [Stigmatella aurantiaca DW4/3-1]